MGEVLVLCAYLKLRYSRTDALAARTFHPNESPPKTLQRSISQSRRHRVCWWTVDVTISPCKQYGCREAAPQVTPWQGTRSKIGIFICALQVVSRSSKYSWTITRDEQTSKNEFKKELTCASTCFKHVKEESPSTSYCLSFSSKAGSAPMSITLSTVCSRPLGNKEASI